MISPAPGSPGAANHYAPFVRSVTFALPGEAGRRANTRWERMNAMVAEVAIHQQSLAAAACRLSRGGAAGMPLVTSSQAAYNRVAHSSTVQNRVEQNSKGWHREAKSSTE